MKKFLLLMLAFALVLGCDYTVPLVTTPGIEIDKSVLGLWRNSAEDKKTEQLLVLPLDKNEYLVFTAIPQYLRKSWNILFSPATRQG
jgi:hypothetical protein